MKRLLIIAMMIIGSAATMMAQGGNMPWKKQIALDIGPQFPSGTGTDNLGTAIGISATFYYQLLSRALFVSGSVGTHNFGIRSTSSSISVIPLLLGFKYNLALTGFQPYVGAEMGIYLLGASGGGTSSSEFGIMPKVGFRYPITAGFDFDASLKHNIILSDFSFTGLNLGVAYTIE